MKPLYMGQKKIPSAWADYDGIGIYSNSKNFPYLNYKIKKKKSNKVILIITTNPMELSEKATIPKKALDLFSLSFLIVYFTILMSSILLQSFIMSIVFSLFTIICLEELIEIFSIDYQVRKTHSGRLMAQFHAAEHMAANAYMELQRVPTLRELKSFSYFHKNCSTIKSIHKILFCFLNSIFLFFILNGIYSLTHIFIYVTINILFVIGVKKRYFMFLEVFSLRKPTNKQLKIVLLLLEFYDKEEKIVETLSDEEELIKYIENMK